LESAIAKLKPPPRRMFFHLMSVEELSNRTHFDWVRNIFNPIWVYTGARVPFGPKSMVMVCDVDRSIDYYVKVVELLKRTPSRVLGNYFGWRVVASFGSFSTETFRRLSFEFDKVKSGLTKQQDRWRACYALTKRKMKWALSRLFVDHHFSTDDRMEVSKFGKHVLILHHI